MAKVVTMGEIMLRLSPPENQRFLQADGFEACYGGGEANVAVSLANYGHEAEFVTKLPNHAIGRCAAAALQKYGVGTKNIAYGGERLGIYFLENGSSVRASQVVYDRADSAIATASVSDFDFDRILDGADLFLFSGILPAISDAATRLAEAACLAAKRKGVTVACDYNYRKKLWSRQKAAETMVRLMPQVDILFGGIDDACNLLGREREAGDTKESVFSALAEKFGLRYVFATARESHSASDNTLSACVYVSDEKKMYSSRSYRVTPIVDRVGAGDAFTGGTLSALLDGMGTEEVLNFGIAASAIKHTIPGDFNLASRDEVAALADGDGAGLVRR